MFTDGSKLPRSDQGAEAVEDGPWPRGKMVLE